MSGCFALVDSLEPRPDEDVFNAFREWVATIVREYGATAGPPPDITRALLGAAQLLSGDLSVPKTILENRPEQPYRLDRGAGYCLTRRALQRKRPRMSEGLQYAWADA